MSELPLLGVRVLDLSRVLAGPLCTMMLGDLGADVLKVERPEIGDETRGWGPPFDEAGRSAYYLSINRNKLSLAADLALDADRALLAGLIVGADVVVDNYRPGTLERHGVDPAALLEANPRLVWCSITGFGADSTRPGYDFVVQAESGWMSIAGEPGGAPMKAGVALADVIAGKDAAASILAMLAGVARGRMLTVPARRISITLVGSATAALVNVAQNVLVSGSAAARWGNAHPNLVPYQLFATADRPIVIAVGSDPQWLACARALDFPELGSAAEYRTNAGRVQGRATLVPMLAARLQERPAAEWLERLARSGVPAGVVRPVADAVREAGGSPLTGMPPATPGTVRRPPPALDEHGADVRARGWNAFDAQAVAPSHAERARDP